MKRRGRPPTSGESATTNRLSNTSPLHYDCSTDMDRNRFDPERLDEQDPFEIDDDNRTHLAKHSPYTAEDLADAWNDPKALFVPAALDGPADWLLVARLPGGDLIEVPVTTARSGEWGKCRPIGIYQAGTRNARSYQQQEDR